MELSTMKIMNLIVMVFVAFVSFILSCKTINPTEVVYLSRNEMYLYQPPHKIGQEGTYSQMHKNRTLWEVNLPVIDSIIHVLFTDTNCFATGSTILLYGTRNGVFPLHYPIDSETVEKEIYTVNSLAPTIRWYWIDRIPADTVTVIFDENNRMFSVH
jgi:hypothetical protein